MFPISLVPLQRRVVLQRSASIMVRIWPPLGSEIYPHEIFETDFELYNPCPNVGLILRAVFAALRPILSLFQNTRQILK